jgi:hypothetical protein
MRKNIYYSLLLSALVTVSVAEETRKVDKHEHGVGELNIAVEGNSIDLEFMIPGADIVGFEYKAKSEADIALVKDALTKFDEFNNIFSIPSTSDCNLVEADISINQGDNHKDEHDDHDEHEDEHDHDDHGEHDDHDEHDEEAHNEFVAHYSFNCGNIKEIDRISFPYFTTFPNSGELEVQFVSEIGSTSFEVEGDEPFIDLKGKI